MTVISMLLLSPLKDIMSLLRQWLLRLLTVSKRNEDVEGL